MLGRLEGKCAPRMLESQLRGVYMMLWVSKMTETTHYNTLLNGCKPAFLVVIFTCTVTYLIVDEFQMHRSLKFNNQGK